MKVKAIGKEYNSGNRKSDGGFYENTIVHVTSKRRGVEGTAVEKVYLDPREYPLASIYIGSNYNLDRDYRGNVEAFELEQLDQVSGLD